MSATPGSLALRAVFFLLLALLGLAGIGVVSNGVVIKNDLISLLPETDSSLAVSEASLRMKGAVGDVALWVVGGADLDAVADAGELIQSKVAATPGLVPVDFQQRAEAFFHYVEGLKPYRFSLLLDQQRTFLRTTPEADILVERLEALYQPAPGSMVAAIAEDPLGLFSDFVTDSADDAGDIYPLGDVTILETENASYALVSASMPAGAFDLNVQQQVLSLDSELQSSIAQGDASLSLRRVGAVFFAARASSRAKTEVGFIAMGSIVGILVLFGMAFRSIKPLLLSLGSVLFGCLSATLITLSLYPQLHLLTLVFGASLIGVAVDYSLHYLTSREDDSKVVVASLTKTATSSSPLNALLPALSLALLTSLIGFGSLLQAPVPGLRQMAVFSMLGLLSTWLFVVVVLPMTAGPANVPSRLIRALALVPTRLHRVWRGSKLSWLFLAVFLALGVYQARVGGDIRVLYEPDPQLLQQQQFVESLLPAYSANQFFLLRADDEQQLLRRCEALRPQLLEIQKRGVISGFLSPCDQLASHKTQSENRRLLAEGPYRRGGVAEQLLQTVGYEADVIDAFRQEMAQEVLLSPGQWQSLAPADLQRTLLGNLGDHYYGLIQLRETNALLPLGELADAYPWLDFVDTVADISATLLQRQHVAALLLVFAYCLIGVVLLLRYREWSALKLLCVPALSSLAVLAIVGLIGPEINLFHIFALFLVLGLGMDYSIFFYESVGAREDCLLAVLLSFATSALSFGLLSFSSTPMISAFGVAVLIGSLGNWLLLPIAVNSALEQQ